MAVRTLNVDTRAADGRVSQRRSVYIRVRARNGPLFSTFLRYRYKIHGTTLTDIRLLHRL